MSRALAVTVSALVVGLVVGSSLTVITYELYDSLRCSQGPIVAQFDSTLTPRLLLNSPYNGSATGTVPIDNGTLQLTLSANNSGGAWGLFESMNWSVRSAHSSQRLTIPCNELFYASAQDRWSSTTLPLFNSTTPYYLNDSAEPRSVQSDEFGEPTLVFFNQFYSTTSVLSTCGRNASTQSVLSSHISFGLQFEFDGSLRLLAVTLTITTEYQYVFPADAGSWDIDNLSASGGPGGGWAFSYLGACT
jgi:hypothetical protein